ncbi:MAG TPA: hypothetical protein VGN18_04180 [Jatrophihabitans sp.]|jgi:hypothetical protein|uniref:hypothetical protein n=1 Tax=Jatrophihabitans sp. TaxID=1932789 RepID=UPI002E06DCFC|nr:hypothetical protein [Jatrophihabitans sp.]
MNTKTNRKHVSTPTVATPDTIAEIHDYYVDRVNNLVAEDREWMIPGLTADYDRLVEQAERIARAA